MKLRRIPRLILILALTLSVMLACFLPASAQETVSMDQVKRQSADVTLGDMAVQRFQVYGLLDDGAKAKDAVTIEAAAKLLNTFFDGVELNPDYGGQRPSEADVAKMFLDAMGYSGYGEDAVGLAESLGLRPVGMAGEYNIVNLGDVMLYMESCLELKDVEGTAMRDRANIPDKLEQMPFPSHITITPTSMEDAEKQIRKAFEYIPYYIYVDTGNGLTKEELGELYDRYKGYLDAALNDAETDEEIWWLPYAYWSKTSTHFNVTKSSSSRLNLMFNYSDSALLIYDLDDAFTIFEDDTITYMADDLYQENVAPYRGKSDEFVVRKIESVICKKAAYEHGHKDRPTAYKITGFFENGKFVCLGYAQLFDYLCTRAGVDCITVLGDTDSPEEANHMEADHIWNKVKVDGLWYNDDVCWGDVGQTCSKRFSLRSDANFLAQTHWPAEHTKGVYTAAKDYAPTVLTPGFSDVPADAYYHDAVLWAVEQGITTGTGNNTFTPNAGCTRGQVITFLWRAAGSPAPKNAVSPFSDVASGSYYHDAVCWAVEQGIAAGTSETTFSPNAVCTRAHVTTFIWRSEGCPVQENADIMFRDVSASAYYYEAARWATWNGLTAGISDNTFAPDSICTRAQAVTMLSRSGIEVR